MSFLNEEYAEEFQEVSVVKTLHPGEFIVDVLPEDVDLQDEVIQAEKDEERLNGYFRNRNKEALDGRKFAVGEMVAVLLESSWRPAMCTDLKHTNGAFTYELLLLDSGQLVEVDFVTFRPLPFTLNSLSRFNAFALLDILPIGMQTGLCRWEADAEEDTRLLMQLASKVFVVTKASYPLSCYKRLFGNVYLFMQTEIIDLKYRLLSKGWAFENSSLFRRVYQLSNENFYDWKPEYTPVEMNVSPNTSSFLSHPRVEEITDAKLDEVLPDCWKVGGSDPLPQVDRERIRRMVMGEACIGFGVTVRGFQRVAAEDSLKREISKSRSNFKSFTPAEYSGDSSNPRSHEHSSLDSDRENSSFSDNSLMKKEDTSGVSQTEEESETESRDAITQEESWSRRNKVHRQFGGENSRLKQNTNRTPVGHEVTPSTKTIFPAMLSDEMRKRILPFFKSVSNSSMSPVINDSGRSGDEDVMSDRSCISSPRSGIANGSIMSPTSGKSSDNEVSDEMKKRVLAIIKGTP